MWLEDKKEGERKEQWPRWCKYIGVPFVGTHYPDEIRYGYLVLPQRRINDD